MKVFKDIFSGDDMFSDGHVFNEVDGVFYEVEGKTITEKTCISDSLIGGNKSAEVQDEELDDQEQTGVNIVFANNLQEWQDCTKHTLSRSIIILKSQIQMQLQHLRLMPRKPWRKYG